MENNGIQFYFLIFPNLLNKKSKNNYEFVRQETNGCFNE